MNSGVYRKISPTTAGITSGDAGVFVCRQIHIAQRPVDLWLWPWHRCLVDLALQPKGVNDNFSSRRVHRQMRSNLCLSTVRYTNKTLLYICLAETIKLSPRIICHLRSDELIQCASRCKWGDFWHYLAHFKWQECVTHLKFRTHTRKKRFRIFHLFSVIRKPYADNLKILKSTQSRYRPNFGILYI